MTPLLEVQLLTKRFASTTVLQQVSFRLASGTILGLIGENGAGKSTLINLLAGVFAPDSGDMWLEGKPYAPANPTLAARSGVRLVHQELNLFPNLSVAENLYLEQLPQSLTGIRQRDLLAQARATLAAVGLHVPPTRPVAQLSPGQRQLVEIAKAFRVGTTTTRPRLIILDEPTTSLTTREAERLFQLIHELRDQGLAVILVSHNLSDILRVTDDILVLRDGQVQDHQPTPACDESALIRLMIGRELQQIYPSRPTRHAATASVRPVLEVNGLSRRDVLHDISFTLQPGEIVGVAGMMGAGRTELLQSIYGVTPTDAGTVRFQGAVYRRRSPRGWLRRGLAYVTEDRRTEGLLLASHAIDNILLPYWQQFARGPWILPAAATPVAHQRADALDLTGPRRQPVDRLSGGNQQKVVFAKWLLHRPHVLLLDEPTRGIDVGAKCELYQTLRQLADDGVAILLVSSDMEELIGLSDRLLVMCHGRIVLRLDASPFDRERILTAALGQEQAA